MIFILLGFIKKIQNILFSKICKHTLFKVGDKFSIEYPVRIIGGKYVIIGNNFRAIGRLRIEAYDRYNDIRYNPNIIIGDNVAFNSDCHIGCIGRVIIGNNVLLASRVFITDHFHGEITSQVISIPPEKRDLYTKGEVVIEDNVWIGEGVAIMPNVRIGKNSIVGANAVVSSSFPPNSIIGGVPAKLIKTL